LGESKFEESLGRKVSETPPISTKKKLDTVAHVCHSNYEGSLSKGIAFQADPGKKHKPLPEK
jgi:hypothetical protein